MNKKGLIGKIFAFIVVVILIILIIAGITIYQVYGLIKTVDSETQNIESNTTMLLRGDCSRIKNIETSVNNIDKSARNTCLNPIIRIGVKKMQQIPVNCDNLDNLKSHIEGNLTQIKTFCQSRSGLTNSSI